MPKSPEPTANLRPNALPSSPPRGATPYATARRSASTTVRISTPSASARGWASATDTAQNVIYVGEGDAHPGLWRPALHIAPGEIHWVNPARALSPGQSARFSVRIRYRQPLQDATLFMRDRGAYILFDQPQRGITPGQFAAWYDGDELVGSGVISE